MKKRWVFFAVLLLAQLSILACSHAQNVTVDVSFYQVPPQEKLQTVPADRAKNVILLIGDGMGIAQITAARIRAVGPGGMLNMDRMPVTGFVRTHSADQLITDSAAGATAYATGHKTNNGMISVAPDSTPLPTILEYLRDKGKATGLVATSTITHATPAGFAAHVPSRRDEATIAEHLLKNRVQVLLGGGKMFFLPGTSEGSKRPDERNLIQEAQKAGYQYVETREALLSATGPYLLGLFQMGGLTTNPPEPMLHEMAQKALEILSKDPDGFFAMIEGSQIDWACHANDPNYEFRQLLLFDMAVGIALEFARKDGHTLVIVTADHETGGLAVNGGSLNGQSLQIAWTTKHHTGTNVPLFAYGPNAERFTGVHDNTEIPRLIAAILGYPDFPPKP